MVHSALRPTDGAREDHEHGIDSRRTEGLHVAVEPPARDFFEESLHRDAQLVEVVLEHGAPRHERNPRAGVCHGAVAAASQQDRAIRAG
jgi:hypothetical protein